MVSPYYERFSVEKVTLSKQNSNPNFRIFIYFHYYFSFPKNMPLDGFEPTTHCLPQETDALPIELQGHEFNYIPCVFLIFLRPSFEIRPPCGSNLSGHRFSVVSLLIKVSLFLVLRSFLLLFSLQLPSPVT